VTLSETAGNVIAHLGLTVEEAAARKSKNAPARKIGHTVNTLSHLKIHWSVSLTAKMRPRSVWLAERWNDGCAFIRARRRIMVTRLLPREQRCDS